MALTLDIDESTDTFDTLLAEMKAFNQNAVNAPPAQRFNVTLRDDSGRIVAGIAATLSADSLYLDIVWAGESARGQGHGRRLMETVEKEGRSRGARYAWLYTMSWQARPFYEKLGYACFGEAPYLGGEHRHYFMRKTL